MSGKKCGSDLFPLTLNRKTTFTKKGREKVKASFSQSMAAVFIHFWRGVYCNESRHVLFAVFSRSSDSVESPINFTLPLILKNHDATQLKVQDIYHLPAFLHLS